MVQETVITEENIVALLPSKSGLSLQDHPSVALAQSECQQLSGANEVSVLEDEEISSPGFQKYVLQ